jgi:hypothetical protein
MLSPQHRDDGRDRRQQRQARGRDQPQDLPATIVPVMKIKPVPHKPGRNVEHDRAAIRTVYLVLREHRTHGRHADPLKLAIPLPCVLAAGPSIFERKPVRFHLGPPHSRRSALG